MEDIIAPGTLALRLSQPSLEGIRFSKTHLLSPSIRTSRFYFGWTPAVPLTTSPSFLTPEEEGDASCQQLRVCVCVCAQTCRCECGSHLGHYSQWHEKAGHNDTHPSTRQRQKERGRVIVWGSVTSTCEHPSSTSWGGIQRLQRWYCLCIFVHVCVTRPCLLFLYLGGNQRLDCHQIP